MFEQESVSRRDAALAFQLTYGVLRNCTRLDYYIEPFLSRSLKRTHHTALNILRLGMFQKLHLERVPDFAIVNECVLLAKRHCGKKTANMVNAVLRKAMQHPQFRRHPQRSKDPVRYLSVKHSFPRWLVQYLRCLLGDDEAEWFMAESNKAAPLDLRINMLNTTMKDVALVLKEAGVEDIKRMRFSPAGIRIPPASMNRVLESGILQHGLATVQDEAAQLVAYLLAPHPEETIIDYCAAPGGKTTHLAECTRDSARIIALDVNADRLERVHEHVQRLHLDSVEARVLDSSLYKRLRAHPADAVIVDAPCTALGTIRRHPDVRWTKTLSDIKRMARLQVKMCLDAVQLLKPGGVFVYSVCTVTDEETRDVVEAIRAQCPALIPQPVLNVLPRHGDEIVDHDGCLRMYPHRHETDGFFAARFILAK